MLTSAYTTLRDRGPQVLTAAIGNLVQASIHRRLLGRRYFEKRIYDYRMMIDLDDRGISRSLLLFGTREVDHKIMLAHCTTGYDGFRYRRQHWLLRVDGTRPDRAGGITGGS